ncbi:hypothetical protein B0H14DRAFT_3425870 [Mycena olivaceomarginata]|nr:hypothetical protein B0H14DRAFT_3425870 [Mycena olivaceomarginata]
MPRGRNDRTGDAAPVPPFANSQSLSRGSSSSLTAPTDPSSKGYEAKPGPKRKGGVTRCRKGKEKEERSIKRHIVGAASIAIRIFSSQHPVRANATPSRRDAVPLHTPRPVPSLPRTRGKKNKNKKTQKCTQDHSIPISPPHEDSTTRRKFGATRTPAQDASTPSASAWGRGGAVVVAATRALLACALHACALLHPADVYYSLSRRLADMSRKPPAFDDPVARKKGETSNCLDRSIILDGDNINEGHLVLRSYAICLHALDGAAVARLLVSCKGANAGGRAGGRESPTCGARLSAPLKVLHPILRVTAHRKLTLVDPHPFHLSLPQGDINKPRPSISPSVLPLRPSLRLLPPDIPSRGSPCSHPQGPQDYGSERTTAPRARTQSRVESQMYWMGSARRRTCGYPSTPARSPRFDSCSDARSAVLRICSVRRNGGAAEGDPGRKGKGKADGSMQARAKRETAHGARRTSSKLAAVYILGG